MTLGAPHWPLRVVRNSPTTTCTHQISVGSVRNGAIAPEHIHDLQRRHRGATKLLHEKSEIATALVQKAIQIRLTPYVGRAARHHRRRVKAEHEYAHAVSQKGAREAAHFRLVVIFGGQADAFD